MSSWMNKPPEFIDPEKSIAAHKVLKREKGVPRDFQNVADVASNKVEKVMPSPARLDPEWGWCFPGLLYLIVGLDKSLFHLYSQWSNVDVPVRTHQSPSHVAVFNNQVVDSNPWMSILQGVPISELQNIRDFIESFSFRRKEPMEIEYGVETKKVRIADPFATTSPKVGVDVVFFLPVAISHQRKVIVQKEAGLTLQTPILTITKEGA